MNETHKRGWLLVVMGLTSLPAIYFAAVPSPSDPLSSWELYISAILGYVGTVLLLWMYIIGNKSVIGLLFRDLAPILKIHAWIGKYAVPLLLLHPLLVTLSYGENLLYMFVPHIDASFERHVTLGRISLFVLIGVWITSAVIRGKIKYRPWKYLHFFGYLAVPFTLLHIPLIGTQFLSHPGMKAYYFALVVAFLAFTYLRARSLFNLDKSRYEITRSEPIGDNTFLVTMRPLTDPIRPPQPGQYVYIKLGYISEDHPFSVVDYHETDGSVTLAYRAYGRFTELLSKVNAGAQVFVSGGYGTFTHEIADTSMPVVFVAGGIGITPFVSHLLGENDNRSHLIYANRSQASSLFLEPLRKRLGKRMTELYSNQPGISPQRIDEATIIATNTDSASTLYYLCGPAGMIKSAQRALLHLGVPKRHIVTEEFMF